MAEYITVQLTDQDAAERISEQLGDNAKVLKTRGFDGADAVISLLIAVTPFLASEISKIIQTLITEKRKIKIIHDGTEYQGMKPQEVAEFIKSIRDHEDAKNKED
jgi:flagellar biosynthesis GTPase FlhF